MQRVNRAAVVRMPAGSVYVTSTWKPLIIIRKHAADLKRTVNLVKHVAGRKYACVHAAADKEDGVERIVYGGFFLAMNSWREYQEKGNFACS